eukprot:2677715-Rhodomonas_salina.1
MVKRAKSTPEKPTRLPSIRLPMEHSGECSPVWRDENVAEHLSSDEHDRAGADHGGHEDEEGMQDVASDGMRGATLFSNADQEHHVEKHVKERGVDERVRHPLVNVTPIPGT